MKRIVFRCLCLCLCLSFTSCGTPAPEESSAPEESEEISLPEDPNAKAVRADLEELLSADWYAVSRGAVWLASNRVETVRERVKKLKAPILTEEDVTRLAERAMLAVACLRQDPELQLALPACGVMGELTWTASVLSSFYPYSYNDCYDALLAYTLYLFTPPDYVFREEEVGDRMPLTEGELCLYLPLAGEISSRADALALLQEGKNGVEVQVSGLVDGEHPLNFYRCGTPTLLLGNGKGMTLDLYDLAVKGLNNPSIPQEFRALYAEEYVQRWVTRVSNVATGSMGYRDVITFPDGTWSYAYVLITPEEAREIRQAVELLSGPILTEKAVRELTIAMFMRMDPNHPFLLPGIDGKPDSPLWADEDNPTLLGHWMIAFFIDLFTPSAYRFEDLPAFSGYCYALRSSAWGYESPETAIADFVNGVTRFVWVDDEGVPCLIDQDGVIDSPEDGSLWV
ncbi:MAG: hypothetical protein J1E00_06990 [Oscillospiraceae bacterium]|nr:hypothetical protein [Oscillospiraceae bacterium]